MGVPFNKEAEALHLTREGGHSHRRIVHVDDATGWAVQAALLKTAEAHPNITLLPGQACIDLITGRHELRYSGSGHVWGVYALDEKTGKVHAHVGRATILASGGAGRDGRRHRDGVARGRTRFQHGNDAVPPDLPL
jgi:L-aspartate oxidase